jgi:precorrin-6B methylase 2
MASPTAVAPDPAGAAAKAVAPSARETARETAPHASRASDPAGPSSRQGTSSSRRPKPPNPFASDADYLGPISATPQKMVSVMLRVAGVQEGDVVFDLGCNDGRVPITAAVEFGATGVGVEIDEGAVVKARRLATEAGVSDRVTILAQNAVRTTGLEKATVVFVYLLPKGNAKISRKLMRETRPGTTVVTYVFRLPRHEWDSHLETVESVSSTRDRGEKTPGVDTGAFNKVFRYRVPDAKPRWCRENIFERAERLARRVGEFVRRFVHARLPKRVRA